MVRVHLPRRSQQRTAFRDREPLPLRSGTRTLSCLPRWQWRSFPWTYSLPCWLSLVVDISTDTGSDSTARQGPESAWVSRHAIRVCTRDRAHANLTHPVCCVRVCCRTPQHDCMTRATTQVVVVQ